MKKVYTPRKVEDVFDEFSFIDKILMLIYLLNIDIDLNAMSNCVFRFLNCEEFCIKWDDNKDPKLFHLSDIFKVINYNSILSKIKTHSKSLNKTAVGDLELSKIFAKFPKNRTAMEIYIKLHWDELDELLLYSSRFQK